jgi:hypothetical protein
MKKITPCRSPFSAASNQVDLSQMHENHPYGKMIDIRKNNGVGLEFLSAKSGKQVSIPSMI